MTNRVDMQEHAGGQTARGTSARERVLRFNRCVIALCAVALLGIVFLPI